MSFAALTAFWAVSFLLVITPGADWAYVISAGLRGRPFVLPSVVGLACGALLATLAVAAGVGSLVEQNPMLLTLLTIAGAAYLAWLGFNLIRSAWKQGFAKLAEVKADADVAQSQVGTADPFQRALVISLLNPKAILFLLSFFVQFIEPSYATPAVPFLILSSIVMVFSALYLSALIFGGAHLAQAFRKRRRLSAGLSSGVGALFVGFGIKLASASIG